VVTPKRLTVFLERSVLLTELFKHFAETVLSIIYIGRREGILLWRDLS